MGFLFNKMKRSEAKVSTGGIAYIRFVLLSLAGSYPIADRMTPITKAVEGL